VCRGICCGHFHNFLDENKNNLIKKCNDNYAKKAKNQKNLSEKKFNDIIGI